MLEAALPTLEVLRLPVQDRLERVESVLRDLVTSDFGPINEVGDYLFSVRGKYLRPNLLLLANEVGGSPDRRAERLAAIVELMHVATLVHDDSVDHSPKRRGLPTVNERWTHQVAVIMGDYLYSRALLEVTRTGPVEAVSILAAASNQMSIGEMRQLAAHDALSTTEADYFRLCRCKTASLMSAACEIGAMVGVSEYREPLAAYGLDLGMAFQIVDDLIDYTVSSDITGKPSGLDLREHKVTLPLIAALPAMDAEARATVSDLFADPEPSDELVRLVGESVREAGGLDHAREQATRFARSARSRLDIIPEDPFVRILRLTVDFVLERQK
ncbi:MAG: polyprenyl synthetase family protein [Gemmatimonadota bacterium]|nr:polyprenyl synthetase family protein [Gemmatimonadota bacterium]MDH3427249.1 polyprenyl synthetase family protein [Gemmatimonadota bacterium]